MVQCVLYMGFALFLVMCPLALSSLFFSLPFILLCFIVLSWFQRCCHQVSPSSLDVGEPFGTMERRLSLKLLSHSPSLSPAIIDSFDLFDSLPLSKIWWSKPMKTTKTIRCTSVGFPSDLSTVHLTTSGQAMGLVQLENDWPMLTS